MDLKLYVYFHVHVRYGTKLAIVSSFVLHLVSMSAAAIAAAASSQARAKDDAETVLALFLLRSFSNFNIYVNDFQYCFKYL